MLAKKPATGPWGCPSPLGEHFWGEGVRSPPRPPMISPLRVPQALREERAPAQLLADLRGHHEEVRWETALGKGRGGLTVWGGPPVSWWGLCGWERLRGEPQREMGAPRRCGAAPPCVALPRGASWQAAPTGRPPLFSLPQAHSCTRKDFEKMYPAFPKFCSVREKLDPTGMFLNTYLEKVFY